MAAPKLIYKVEIGEGSELSPVEVISHGIDGYKHVVQTDKANEKPLNLAEALVQDPDKVFNDPLGLLFQYTKGKSHELIKKKFNSVKEKSSILGEVEEKLLKHTKKRSLIDELLLVADEMLTNAVFNAPFASPDKLESGPSRDGTADVLQSVQAADFFLGMDEEHVMVGCIDHYGKINIPKLLERIKFCYDNSVANAMNMDKPGGAGIGTYIIYNNSSSLLVGVLPGKKTIFCSFFPLKGSNRERASRPKSLYLIY